MKETMQPHDVAFNKLYFVNLFSNNSTDFKCKNYQEANFRYPTLAAIANKLTAKEVEYLINKIEEIL